ncbi:MAG: hypothetical protein PHI84_01575 [Kiritimatiellae bacterium]|nr:hypothetical protein [Kiritimatiellia bacterium]
MARILSDKEIQKLLDNGMISKGDLKQIRANSYVFRLGQEVRFFSTKEKKTGILGDILEINAGDSALVHSIEIVDFSQEVIDRLYKGYQLCALLTPSTTLIREGLQLPSTKIDPGYMGTLNWTIRNSGIEPVQMELGEPIFKATFFLLVEKEEIPQNKYGSRSERDFYHGKTGLVDSKRRLPVDINTRKKICVSSKGTEFERLKQSGFPYDFIATQLKQVGDQMEIVTDDFARIDDHVKEQNKDLTQKINEIEGRVQGIIDKKMDSVFERMDNMVFKKLVGGGVAMVSLLMGLGAGVKYLIDIKQSSLITPIASVLAVVGVLSVVIYSCIGGRRKPPM